MTPQCIYCNERLEETVLPNSFLQWHCPSCGYRAPFGDGNAGLGSHESLVRMKALVQVFRVESSKKLKEIEADLKNKEHRNIDAYLRGKRSVWMLINSMTEENKCDDKSP